MPAARQVARSAATAVATGELLRDLIIDPRKDYQPTGAPPDPTPK
ncbi:MULTISPECIES: hypothetical protein [unclassified Nocardioides]|nr:MULTISPECIES: hypothetical protein [unclassified Nocardioides]